MPDYDVAAVEERVDLIPDDGEWWDTSGREKFVEIAQELTSKHGLTLDEAISVLEKAYSAVAAEFGN